MENETNIGLAIVAGSLIMFLLVLLIIVFVITYSKRLKEKENQFQLSIKNNELELLRGIIDAQDNEREKIAASLHDEIGPLLTVLKLNLTKHSRSLEKQTLTPTDLQEERSFIDSIITNIRGISHELTPHFVKNNGLVYGLNNFASSIKEPQIEIISDFDDQPIRNTALTISCYRIVLELLNNVIKYDNPKEIILSLYEKELSFIINIKHDGPGISQEDYLAIIGSDQNSGLDLNSIQSRLLVHNGTIHYSCDQNFGQIKLEFPLKNEQKN